MSTLRIGGIFYHLNSKPSQVTVYQYHPILQNNTIPPHERTPRRRSRMRIPFLTHRSVSLLKCCRPSKSTILLLDKSSVSRLTYPPPPKKSHTLIKLGENAFVLKSGSSYGGQNGKNTLDCCYYSIALPNLKNRKTQVPLLVACLSHRGAKPYKHARIPHSDRLTQHSKAL